MKIKLIDHGIVFGDSSVGRSKGLHLSDIYGAYYRKLAGDKHFREKGDFDATTLTRFETGFAFEDVLEPALATRWLGKRPKELKYVHVRPNGVAVTIYYSPDYAFFVDGETILGEFKLTWYSCKGAPRDKKFQQWITQVKLYCYLLKLNKAWLFAYFINGDYKPPKPKPPMCWELVFTDEELAEEWDIMMRFAEEEGLFEQPSNDVRKGHTGADKKAHYRKPSRRSRRR